MPARFSCVSILYALESRRLGPGLSRSVSLLLMPCWSRPPAGQSHPRSLPFHDSGDSGPPVSCLVRYNCSLCWLLSAPAPLLLLKFLPGSCVLPQVPGAPQCWASHLRRFSKAHCSLSPASWRALCSPLHGGDMKSPSVCVWDQARPLGSLSCRQAVLWSVLRAPQGAVMKL